MRPQLQSDDIGQYMAILDRLRRLEQRLSSSGAFLAYMAAAQSIGSAVDTKLAYVDTATGSYDTDESFDAASSSFRAPASGSYTFSASIGLPTPGAVGTRWIMRLYVSGSSYRQMKIDWTAASWSNDYALIGHSGLVVLDADDLVDVRINQNSGGAINVGAATVNTFFSGSRIT